MMHGVICYGIRLSESDYLRTRDHVAGDQALADMDGNGHIAVTEGIIVSGDYGKRLDPAELVPKPEWCKTLETFCEEHQILDPQVGWWLLPQ